MADFPTKVLLWHSNLLGNFIGEPFSRRGKPKGVYYVLDRHTGWRVEWRPNNKQPVVLAESMHKLSVAIRACEEHFEKYGE